MLAKSAGVRPVVAREVLVHHADSLCAARIVGGEESSFPQGEAHGAKVVAVDAIRIVSARRFAGPENVAFHRGGALAAVAAEGHIVDHAGGQHSRLVAESRPTAFR